MGAMGFPQKSLAYIEPEEYLALEAVAKEKHEYLDGRIYAWQGVDTHGMAGAPLDHNRVCLNIVRSLWTQTRGTDCEVMMSEIRVRPHGSNAYFYPDVIVRCGPALPGNTTEIDDACLVVEVLSDSTEAFDRSEKFERYQLMPALDTYVLVSPGTWTIETFSRDANWRAAPVIEARGTALPALLSHGLQLDVRDVFEGMSA